MRKIEAYDLFAAGVAAALAGFELSRTVVGMIMGQDTSRVTPLFSAIGGVTAFVVLGLSAVGLALHRRFGWGFGVGGVLVSLGYGVVLLAAGTNMGLVFMLGGVLMVPALAKSLQDYRVVPRFAVGGA